MLELLTVERRGSTHSIEHCRLREGRDSGAASNKQSLIVRYRTSASMGVANPGKSRILNCLRRQGVVVCLYSLRTGPSTGVESNI